MRKTIWFAEGRVAPGGNVVVVAEVNDRRVTISEETSTSSQEVSCNTVKMKKALIVKTDEELMKVLEKHFGTIYGYYDAQQYMEDNGIEYDWWGGSN